MLPQLKFYKINKREVVISPGEIIDEMYFVLKGFLSLNLGPEYDSLEVSLIEQGNYFGDLLLLLNEICTYELKYKSDFSEILVL